MEDDASGPELQRMLELPADLRAAVEAALGTTSQARWMQEAQALSVRYRGERSGETQPLATGPAQVLGYAALIMPATYAQLRGAMAATGARIPAWQPTTMLDLGSGPGTAIWAAAEQWPTLRQNVAWEREAAFISLGRTLARGSGSAAVRQTRWVQTNLNQMQAHSHQRYDLVVLGHVLNELTPEQQKVVVATAWEMTAGLLLIVEPGTSATFPHVDAARNQLLALDARTIAPCAHNAPCPLIDEWCHFPQRLKRPAFQRRARGAPSEWEDAKFSYAAMARFGPELPIWGRVIREPSSNKAYAEAMISSREGVARYQALKRYREAFHLLRKLPWGAALKEAPPAPIAPTKLSPTSDRDTLDEEQG